VHIQVLQTLAVVSNECCKVSMQEAKVLLAMIARGYDVSNATGHSVDWGISPGGAGGSPAADVYLEFTPHQHV